MVAAIFDSALEALLRHDSVRNSDKYTGSEALWGVTWEVGRQRWRASITHDRRRLSLGYFQQKEHAAKVRDLMAIKTRGMQAPLNFVPETYNDMYELLAQVDQALLLELLQAFNRTRNKLLAESAWQQQRMACEAALAASDPTMGTDCEDAAPTATTLSCQPSPPLAPYSAAGGGMAMGSDVATRFDSALEAVLSHASVRVPSNLNRHFSGSQRHHIDAGDLCGVSWNKAQRYWAATCCHESRSIYIGHFQHKEHAAKAHDLMAIKLHGMHTPGCWQQCLVP
ncbi:hypothetical protein V8C86DRAFT_970438 [Haematococcus lacustris]